MAYTVRFMHAAEEDLRRAPSGKAHGGDAETRALAANPRFWQLIEEGRRSGPGLTVEESNARADITEEEWAAADAEIDRLLGEQAAERRGNGTHAQRPPRDRPTAHKPANTR